MDFIVIDLLIFKWCLAHQLLLKPVLFNFIALLEYALEAGQSLNDIVRVDDLNNIDFENFRLSPNINSFIIFALMDTIVHFLLLYNHFFDILLASWQPSCTHASLTVHLLSDSIR